MRHRGDGTQIGPARGGRVRLLIVLAALLVFEILFTKSPSQQSA